MARATAARMAERHPEISRVVLFGSFSREDFTARSDMDLLVILKSSNMPIRERIAEFLKDCADYPTDVFPLTEDELRARLRDLDPFWTRAINEGIRVL